jgi:hypothetical protein
MIEDAGANAVDGSVSISSRDGLAAGRDVIYQEGLRLRTKMRASARNCLKAGVVLFLFGFFCVGYFVLSWNGRIFDMVSGSMATGSGGPDLASLPSPYPWVPLGAVMCFAGLVLVVAAFLLPRDVIGARRERR